MLYILIYSWVIFALDWSSTIEAHNCLVEENPLMRYAWCTYGEVGFTLFSVAFALLMHFAIAAGYRYGYKSVTFLTAFVVLTFKLLIALTNLVIVPLWVTGWWSY